MNYSKGQNDSIVKDFQAGKFYLFKSNVSYYPCVGFNLSCKPTTPNPELEYTWSVPKFIHDAIDEVYIEITVKDGVVTHFVRTILPDNDRYTIHFDIRFEWEKKDKAVNAEKELIEKLNALIVSNMDRGYILNPVKEIEAIFNFVDNSLSNKQETKMNNIISVLDGLSSSQYAITSAFINYWQGGENGSSPSTYKLFFDGPTEIPATEAVKTNIELAFGGDGSLYVECSVKKIESCQNRVELSICTPPVKLSNDTAFNKMVNKLPQLIGHLIRKLNSGASGHTQQVSLITLTKAVVFLIKEKMVSVPKLDLSFAEQTLRQYVKDWDAGESVSHAVGWNKKDLSAETYSVKVALSELTNVQVDIALEVLKSDVLAMKENKPAQIFHISPEYTKNGFTFTFSYYYGD